MGKTKSKGRDQNTIPLTDIHSLIAKRYEVLCKKHCIKPDDRQTTMMDLYAVSKAYPSFDWKGLLAADDGNFSHDLCGIKRHIDRSKAFTGKDDLAHLLTDCFLPRFARRATPATSKQPSTDNG